MQVPLKCININQESVLRCLATDHVSAEFSLDVSPFANNSCREAWSELVKYALALFPGQAVATRHQGLQLTPA